MDAFRFQATIGILELLIRRVALFAKDNPEYQSVQKIITPEFKEELR